MKEPVREYLSYFYHIDLLGEGINGHKKYTYFKAHQKQCLVLVQYEKI